jgi:hypothetical protein
MKNPSEMEAGLPDDIFHTKNINLEIFWKATFDVGIQRPFGVFCGHLVYF